MRTLLKPTHLYPAPVLELIKKINVKGMAHITGGGLTENIPRILKKDLIANVELSSWKFPKAFLWLQEKGKISTEDMLRIFNCGIGMVCILDKKEVSKAQKILSSYKLRSFEIGSITKGKLQGRIQYN
jgi:phosphoribosylformylglycinamidine cyclo-ligase